MVWAPPAARRAVTASCCAQLCTDHTTGYRDTNLRTTTENCTQRTPLASSPLTQAPWPSPLLCPPACLPSATVRRCLFAACARLWPAVLTEPPLASSSRWHAAAQPRRRRPRCPPGLHDCVGCVRAPPGSGTAIRRPPPETHTTLLYPPRPARARTCLRAPAAAALQHMLTPPFPAVPPPARRRLTPTGCASTRRSRPSASSAGRCPATSPWAPSARSSATSAPPSAPTWPTSPPAPPWTTSSGCICSPGTGACS